MYVLLYYKLNFRHGQYKNGQSKNSYAQNLGSARTQFGFNVFAIMEYIFTLGWST